MAEIDYLIIGHVCKDLTPAGPRLGGTVTFSALMAQALGLRAGLVTSAPDELLPLMEPLQSIPMIRVPAEAPTTFQNVYTPAGRQQMIYDRAAWLAAEHIPSGWRQAPVVHLAPIANEVDPSLVRAFPGALLGVTPQGWMRRWDTEGCVSLHPWDSADSLLPDIGALVLSIEDIRYDEALAASYARQTALLVVTRGAEGCTLYAHGERYDIPAPSAAERDPTGAGDIFAAAFFVRLHQTGDPAVAARFATLLASDSVMREGLDGIPVPERVRQAAEEA